MVLKVSWKWLFNCIKYGRKQVSHSALTLFALKIQVRENPYFDIFCLSAAQNKMPSISPLSSCWSKWARPQFIILIVSNDNDQGVDITTWVCTNCHLFPAFLFLKFAILRPGQTVYLKTTFNSFNFPGQRYVL